MNAKVVKRIVLSSTLIILCASCHKKKPHISHEEYVIGKTVTTIKVKDGDSILLNEKEVRLLGIDAPEKKAKFFSGDQGRHAKEATVFLTGLIQKAEKLDIYYSNETETWGRHLAYVLADGENVNAKLVEAGLAYETVTQYGHNGYPEYAKEVLRASKKWDSLPFEKPDIFRKRGGNKER